MTNNHTTPIPNSINWGNLLINYTSNIGGNWNQQASITTVQGNLVILNTGAPNQEFHLTSNINMTLNIGGNLEVSNGVLLLLITAINIAVSHPMAQVLKPAKFRLLSFLLPGKVHLTRRGQIHQTGVVELCLTSLPTY